jgi:hypothetical protein
MPLTGVSAGAEVYSFTIGPSRAPTKGEEFGMLVAW